MKNISVKENLSTPYICGGVARDFVMGNLKKINDIDITTGDLSVKELSKKLYEYFSSKFKVEYKLSTDGHQSIFFNNMKIDFSSHFVLHDIDVILKKMGVTTINSMMEEIYSRDFTCNSLLLGTDMKEVRDLTHRGSSDIKEKVIRTILDPSITLTQNKNRVVRAIYGAIHLGFTIDPKIVQFVQSNPASFTISTSNQVKEKLSYCFKKDPEKTSRYISDMGLWELIPLTPETQAHVQKNYLHSSQDRNNDANQK